MEAATVTPAATARAIESKVCSRCGGTGNYSYCSMYGTRCFKCGGAKMILTKRGAAANTYLTALRSKPAGTLEPGTVVRVGTITFAGDPNRVWTTVVSVTPVADLHAGWSRVVDGKVVPHDPVPGVEVVTKHVTLHCKADELVRVAQSAEQKAETLRQALDYQDTLTQDGKPKKRRAAKKAAVA